MITNVSRWVFLVALIVVPKSSPATDILIKKLKCRTTEDYTGADECRLMIYADDKLVKVFYDDLNDGDEATVSFKFSFNNSATAKLYDDDIPSIGDAHDFLGQIDINSNSTNGVGVFDRDDAFYELTWSIIAPPPPSPNSNTTPNPNPTPPSQTKMDSMKSTLEKFLSSELAQGNEGKATIEKFEFKDGKIKFDVKIRHRHKTNGVILYSVNTNVSGEFNPSDLTSIKNTKLCSNLPPALGGGEICITLEQVAALLAA